WKLDLSRRLLLRRKTMATNCRLRHHANALQPQWTIWKRNSSAAKRKSWSRPAWPDRTATALPLSKWCAAKPKLAETIPAPADQAKNTKSAMARGQRRKSADLDLGWGRVPSS